MSAVVEIEPHASIYELARGPIRIASAFYTADQLAELLQVCTRQIWRMRDGGQLPPPIKVGRLVRWSRAVVDEWISKGCPQPKSR